MDCVDPPGLALQLAEIPPVSVHLQILDDQSTDQIQQLIKQITINELEVTQSPKLKPPSQPNTPKNKNTTQKKGKPNPRKTRTKKNKPKSSDPNNSDSGSIIDLREDSGDEVVKTTPKKKSYNSILDFFGEPFHLPKDSVSLSTLYVLVCRADFLKTSLKQQNRRKRSPLHSFVNGARSKFVVHKTQMQIYVNIEMDPTRKDVMELAVPNEI